jgi:hypothetical protein
VVTCKRYRWCDESPGHVGTCSRQIGSMMAHRQNGDEVVLSVRILMNHRKQQVVELQLGDTLIQMDPKERAWLQRQLDDSEKHTRD